MDERTTDPPAADASASQPPVPRTGEDGKPVYDQEFFLALARRGKDAWNWWRENNLDIPVTLKGVDFRDASDKITFAGFQFGCCADLSGATFEGGADFSGATFGDWTSFSRTVLKGRANFSGASFGARMSFSHATFGNLADFSGASFGEWLNFYKATFRGMADFSGSIFGHRAILRNVAFGGPANFSGTIFENAAHLTGSIFSEWGDFSGRSAEDWIAFRKQLIERSLALQSLPEDQKDAFVRLNEALRSTGAGPDSFRHVSFSSARFVGFANFSGRKFTERFDLGGTHFLSPPSFDSSERLDRLDLYGIRVGIFGFQMRGWTPEGQAGNQLRRLRELAEMTNNHDLERDLYIEERKAERGIMLAQYWSDGWRSLLAPRLYSHCLWIAVMAAYSLLADYGRSFLRPLVALFASVFVFHAAYWMVLSPPNDPNNREGFRRAVWAFSVANAVPFAGVLTLERDVKLRLFCRDGPMDAEAARRVGAAICSPVPETGFQLAAFGQSIFSALCIFFAGLALRNYFKLR